MSLLFWSFLPSLTHDLVVICCQDDGLNAKSEGKESDIVNDRAINYDQLAKQDDEEDAEHDDTPLKFEGLSTRMFDLL